MHKDDDAKDVSDAAAMWRTMAGDDSGGTDGDDTRRDDEADSAAKGDDASVTDGPSTGDAADAKGGAKDDAHGVGVAAKRYWYLAAVAVLVVAIVVTCVCVARRHSPATNVSGDATSTSLTPEQAAESSRAAAGQTGGDGEAHWIDGDVTMGDITVTDDGDGLRTAKVDIMWTNHIGRDAEPVDHLDVTADFGGGVVQAAYLDGGTDVVADGAPVTITATFDVPQDATGVTVHVADVGNASAPETTKTTEF